MSSIVSLFLFLLYSIYLPVSKTGQSSGPSSSPELIYTNDNKSNAESELGLFAG